MNAERHSKNFLNKQVAPLFFLSLILIFFFTGLYQTALPGNGGWWSRLIPGSALGCRPLFHPSEYSPVESDLENTVFYCRFYIYLIMLIKKCLEKTIT